MASLSSYETFLRAAELESFSGAARILGLSAPSVSRLIGNLEADLDVRLFNRTTRKVSLTDEGQALYRRVAHAIQDIKAAEAELGKESQAPSGTLHLDVPSGFGQSHIAPLLPRFMARFPALRVDMSLNDRFVNLIEEGKDLAIRIGQLSDSSLIARRLFTSRRVLVATERYLARRGIPDVPQDLALHNCLVYAYRVFRNEWRFRPPEGGEVSVAVNGNLETNNGMTIRLAILDDMGVALLPHWLVAEDIAAGRLVELLPGYQTPDAPIWAVFPGGRHVPAKTRAFIDFLKGEVPRRLGEIGVPEVG